MNFTSFALSNIFHFNSAEIYQLRNRLSNQDNRLSKSNILFESYRNENTGEILLKMVLTQFDHKAKPKNVVLTSKLIIRDSVKNLK
jgi:hypothetical protein